MHYEDEGIEAAARREISYFSKSIPEKLVFRGVVHFRAFIGEEVASHTITNIFSMYMHSDDMTHEKSLWHDMDAIQELKLSPSTREIIELCQTRSEFFFETFLIHY